MVYGYGYHGLGLVKGLGPGCGLIAGLLSDKEL